MRSCVGIEDEWGEQQWYFLDPLEDEREREIVERERERETERSMGNWRWLGEEEERVQEKGVQGGVLEGLGIGGQRMRQATLSSGPFLPCCLWDPCH